MPAVEDFILNFKIKFDSADTSLTNFTNRARSAQKVLDSLKANDVKVNFNPAQITTAFNRALAVAKLEAKVNTALTVTAKSINFEPLKKELHRKLAESKTSGGSNLKEDITVNVHLGDTTSVINGLKDYLGKRELEITPVLDKNYHSRMTRDLEQLKQSASTYINVGITGLEDLREAATAAKALKSRDIHTDLIIKTETAQASINTFHDKNKIMKINLEVAEEVKGTSLQKIKEKADQVGDIKFKATNFDDSLSKRVRESIEKAADTGIRSAFSKLNQKDAKPIKITVDELKVRSIVPTDKAIKDLVKDVSSKLLASLKSITVGDVIIQGKFISELKGSAGVSSSGEGSRSKTLREVPEEELNTLRKKVEEFAPRLVKVFEKSYGSTEKAMEAYNNAAMKYMTNPDAFKSAKNDKELALMLYRTGVNKNKDFDKKSRRAVSENQTSASGEEFSLSETVSATQPNQRQILDSKKILQRVNSILKKLDVKQQQLLALGAKVHEDDVGDDPFSLKHLRTPNYKGIYNTYKKGAERKGVDVMPEAAFIKVYKKAAAEALRLLQSNSDPEDFRPTSTMMRKNYFQDTSGIDQYLQLSAAGSPNKQQAKIVADATNLKQQKLAPGVLADYDATKHTIRLRAEIAKSEGIVRDLYLIHELIHSFFEGYGKTTKEFAKKVNTAVSKMPNAAKVSSDIAKSLGEILDAPMKVQALAKHRRPRLDWSDKKSEAILSAGSEFTTSVVGVVGAGRKGATNVPDVFGGVDQSTLVKLMKEMGGFDPSTTKGMEQITAKLDQLIQEALAGNKNIISELLKRFDFKGSAAGQLAGTDDDRNAFLTQLTKRAFSSQEQLSMLSLGARSMQNRSSIIGTINPTGATQGAPSAFDELQSMPKFSYQRQIIEQRKALEEKLRDNVQGGGHAETHVIKIMDETGQRIRVNQKLWIQHGQVVAVNAEKQRGLNAALDQSVSHLQRVARRVLEYGAVSFVLYKFVGVLQQAQQTIIGFDYELKSMQSITRASAGELEFLSRAAINIGKDYGKSIVDVGKSMNDFLRQGVRMSEISASTRAAMLLSNISTIEAKDANEQLLRVMKQYDIPASQSIRTIDRLTAVSDAYAVTLKDLTEGVGRSGSVAKTFGVDLDHLIAIIATVGEATQRSGKEVGNAFRTIFARGISPGALKVFDSLGISITDTEGKLRGFTEIIDEVGKRWDNLSQLQKISIGESLGGRTRLNEVLTLFENYDTYLKAISVSSDSAGSATEKNRIIMESLQKQIDASKASLQGLAVAMSGTFTTVLSVVTSAVQGLAQSFAFLDEQLGGSLGAMSGFGLLAAGGLGSLSMLGNSMSLNTKTSRSAGDHFFAGKTDKELFDKLNDPRSRNAFMQNLQAGAATSQGVGFGVPVAGGTGARAGAWTASRLGGGVAGRLAGGAVAGGIGLVAGAGMTIATLGAITLAFGALAAIVHQIIKFFKYLNMSTQDLSSEQQAATASLRENTETIRRTLGNTGKLKIDENGISLRDPNNPLTDQENQSIYTELAKNKDLARLLKVSVGEGGNLQMGLKGLGTENSLERLNQLLSRYEGNAVKKQIQAIGRTFDIESDSTLRGAVKRFEGEGMPVRIGTNSKDSFFTDKFRSTEAREFIDTLSSGKVTEASEKLEKLSEVMGMMREQLGQLVTMKGFDLNAIISDDEDRQKLGRNIQTYAEQVASVNQRTDLLKNRDQKKELGRNLLGNQILQSQNINVFEDTDFLNPQSLTNKVMGNDKQKGLVSFDSAGKLKEFSREVSIAYGNIKNAQGEMVPITVRSKEALDRVSGVTVAFSKGVNGAADSLVFLTKRTDGSLGIVEKLGDKVQELTDERFQQLTTFTDSTSAAFLNQANSIEHLIDSLENLGEYLDGIAERQKNIQGIFDIRQGRIDRGIETRGYAKASDITGTSKNIQQSYEQLALIRDQGLGKSSDRQLALAEIKESVLQGSGSNRGILALEDRMKSLFLKLDTGEVKPGTNTTAEITKITQEVANFMKFAPGLVTGAEERTGERGAQAIKGLVDAASNTLELDLSRLIERGILGDNNTQTSVGTESVAQKAARLGVIVNDPNSDIYKTLNRNTLPSAFTTALTGESKGGSRSGSSEVKATENDISQQTKERLKQSMQNIDTLQAQAAVNAETYRTNLSKVFDSVGQVIKNQLNPDNLIDPSLMSQSAKATRVFKDSLAMMLDQLIKTGEFDGEEFADNLKKFNESLRLNQETMQNARQLRDTSISGLSGTGDLTEQFDARRKAAINQRNTLMRELQDAGSPVAKQEIIKRLKATEEDIFVNKDKTTGADSYGARVVDIAKQMAENEKSLPSDQVGKANTELLKGENAIVQRLIGALVKDQTDARKAGLGGDWVMQLGGLESFINERLRGEQMSFSGIGQMQGDFYKSLSSSADTLYDETKARGYVEGAGGANLLESVDMRANIVNLIAGNVKLEDLVSNAQAREASGSNRLDYMSRVISGDSSLGNKYRTVRDEGSTYIKEKKEEILSGLGNLWDAAQKNMQKDAKAKQDDLSVGKGSATEFLSANDKLNEKNIFPERGSDRLKDLEGAAAYANTFYNKVSQSIDPAISEELKINLDILNKNIERFAEGVGNRETYFSTNKARGNIADIISREGLSRLGLPTAHSGALATDEFLAVLQSGEAVIPRNLVSQIPSSVLSRLPSMGGSSQSKMLNNMSKSTLHHLPRFHNGLAPTTDNGVEVSALTREIANLAAIMGDLSRGGTRNDSGANSDFNDGLLETMKLLYDGIVELRNSQNNLGNIIGEHISQAMTTLNPTQNGNAVVSETRDGNDRLDVYVNGEARVALDYTPADTNGLINGAIEQFKLYLQNNPNEIMKILMNQPMIGN